MRRLLYFAALAGFAAGFETTACAETYTLTLKQAIDRALTQNPEVIMARLDELKSAAAVKLTQAPFTPRLGMGSGAAYSNGFPLSIEGSAPAAFNVKADQYLFNRPQTYAVAQARETARGAGIASDERRDDVVYRAAELFIDVDRAGRLAEAAQKQVDSLRQVLDSVNARVESGRDLPVAKEEATVNFLRARQRLLALQSDREYAERNLAVALGYTAGDAVRPAAEERVPPGVPETEEAALRTALEGSKELRRLESNYQAKVLEIKGYKAQRLPRVDLVGQYALLTRYSHYDEYYRKFQRHNGQIGASFQIPILAGSSIGPQVAQGEADQQHIRAEIRAARNRITLDVHQSYQEIAKADLASQVAKAEVDLTHSQLSILLAQMNEGRASLRQVEEARFNEDEKWIAFYDAQFNSEKARLNVLKQTGELTAALR
jgi:outer membrane protein TolC